MPFTLTDFLSAYFVFGLPSWILGAGMVLGWYISRNKAKIISNNTPSAPKGEFRLNRPEPPTRPQRPVQAQKIYKTTHYEQILRDIVKQEDQREFEDLERISKYLSPNDFYKVNYKAEL